VVLRALLCGGGGVGGGFGQWSLVALLFWMSFLFVTYERWPATIHCLGFGCLCRKVRECVCLVHFPDVKSGTLFGYLGSVNQWNNPKKKKGPPQSTDLNSMAATSSMDLRRSGTITSSKELARSGGEIAVSGSRARVRKVFPSRMWMHAHNYAGSSISLSLLSSLFSHYSLFTIHYSLSLYLSLPPSTCQASAVLVIYA
jgi:hypothetical protein